LRARPLAADGADPAGGSSCVLAHRQLRAEAGPTAGGHTDFHRPFSVYLNALGRQGLSFERLEEPTLPPEALKDPDAPPHAALLQHVPTFAVLSAVKVH